MTKRKEMSTLETAEHLVKVLKVREKQGRSEPDYVRAMRAQVALGCCIEVFEELKGEAELDKKYLLEKCDCEEAE